ncbi:MFS transporter [Cellulomonas sp. H30R-01]|uniref:MFS transporter n=1 Tax=Cellulomonas sp. H30R-01 TaxID=2704467 RepID=UPI00138B8258|nr:MFS transporter [Cellulomonas sp. H30R-01]QHT57566.1 MFS transporter [Cellulomonas sp. H30R-01]
MTALAAADADRASAADRRVRPLVLAAGLDSVGTGVFAASATVFFVSTGVVTAAQAATAATVAGVVALLVQAASTRAVARVDVPLAYAVVSVVRCLAYLGFVLVDDPPAYVALLLVGVCSDRAASPLFQLLVAQAVPDDRRVTAMARVRSVRNVGLAVGFGLAAATLALGPTAVRASFVLNAVSFLGLAGVALRLRRAATVTGAPVAEPASSVPPHASPGVRSPWRDRRYVALTVGNAVLSLHDALLFIGIPLWLVERTDLELSLVPLTLVLNAVLTVAAQAVIARALARGRPVASLVLPAAVLLVGACAAMAFVTTGTPEALAVGLLAVAVVALSIAENLQAVAGWELSFVLVPEGGRARYVAAFNVGVSAQKALGPGAVTSALLIAGTAGWAALAVAFAGAALVLRAAARPRPDVQETTCTS